MKLDVERLVDKVVVEGAKQENTFASVITEIDTFDRRLIASRSCGGNYCRHCAGTRERLASGRS